MGMKEWISVKDRLPEKNQKVLVYAKDKDSYLIELAEFLPDQSFWFIGEGWNNKYISNLIKCWMSLPEPPNES